MQDIPFRMSTYLQVSTLQNSDYLEISPIHLTCTYGYPTHGVRVNSVAPGPIETEMLNRLWNTAGRKAWLLAGVPAKRFGKPEVVAQIILFLSSDKAPFITGTTIGIDGGKLA
jgi:NAD(P)-dependent dehydrogenase (short-subunit alcohol dehydrogenase family)